MRLQIRVSNQSNKAYWSAVHWSQVDCEGCSGGKKKKKENFLGGVRVFLLDIFCKKKKKSVLLKE